MDAKNQHLVIDLERNDDLAKLVADSEPGDKLTMTVSIVAKNDKSLTVEVESVKEGAESTEEDDDEKPEDADTEEEAEGYGDTPAMKVMKGQSG